MSLLKLLPVKWDNEWQRPSEAAMQRQKQRHASTRIKVARADSSSIWALASAVGRSASCANWMPLRLRNATGKSPRIVERKASRPDEYKNQRSMAHLLSLG